MFYTVPVLCSSVWDNAGILKLELPYQSNSKHQRYVLCKRSKRQNFAHKKKRATTDAEKKPVLAHTAGSASFLYCFYRRAKTFKHYQSAGICIPKETPGSTPTSCLKQKRGCYYYIQWEGLSVCCCTPPFPFQCTSFNAAEFLCTEATSSFPKSHSMTTFISPIHAEQNDTEVLLLSLLSSL